MVPKEESGQVEDLLMYQEDRVFVSNYAHTDKNVWRPEHHITKLGKAKHAT